MITLNVWGGLAGQLAGLSYGIWIKKNTNHDVRLNLRSGGISHRNMEIKELLEKSELEFFFTDDWGYQTNSLKSLAWRISDSFLKFYNQFLLRVKYVYLSEITKSYLQNIPEGKFVINGSLTDWAIIDETWSTLSNLIDESKFPNFAKPKYENNGIAVHVRRGDYISNSKAHAYHGTVTIRRICEVIDCIYTSHSQDEVVFFTDSPDFLSQEFSDLKVNFEYKIVSSRSIWEDLFLMCTYQHFIGTNSGISLWAGISYKNQPEKLGAQVYLPIPWIQKSSTDDITEKFIISKNFIVYDPEFFNT